MLEIITSHKDKGNIYDAQTWLEFEILQVVICECLIINAFLFVLLSSAYM